MLLAISRRFYGVVIALWYAAERAQQMGSFRPRRNGSDFLGRTGRATITAALDRFLTRRDTLRHTVAAFVFEIDGFRKIEETHDRDSTEILMDEITQRIAPLLGIAGVAVHLEGGRFAIAQTVSQQASPQQLSLESAIQFASRIQHAMAEPIFLSNCNLYITVSVGFALAIRLDGPTGQHLLRAANIAQLEASRGGPNAVRSYSPAMHARIVSHDGLRTEIRAALQTQQITAHFQPQINLATGALTGLEALARWNHPQRGLVAPCDFLPVLEQSGLLGLLGQCMLRDALTALQKWDQGGLHVPQVSINMSNEELQNPYFVEHIMMELDRCNIAANRLVIEVLETVVVSNTDNIAGANLTKLAAMGCGIDLDDFGTGHASITSIRKFSIQRIKIDRSFITNIDRDEEQQNMVAAILIMAGRLGLDTLAEGIETPQEQDQLTKMGCRHMQGFALAQPADFAKTTQWITSYRPVNTQYDCRAITLPRQVS